MFAECGWKNSYATDYLYSCQSIINSTLAISSYATSSYKIVQNWTFYLNQGLNNISINDSTLLKMGTLFIWSSADGAIIQLLQPNLNGYASFYQDAIIEIGTNALVKPLNSNSLNAFNFKAKFDVFMKSYSFSFQQFYKKKFSSIPMKVFFYNQTYFLQNNQVNNCKFFKN